MLNLFPHNHIGCYSQGHHLKQRKRQTITEEPTALATPVGKVFGYFPYIRFHQNMVPSKSCLSKNLTHCWECISVVLNE